MNATLLTSKTVFDITSYGAVGDGISDATAALHEAIEACHQNGNGVVWVPPGTFAIKPVYLKSNVHLHLARGATLLGSARAEDYPEWESRRIHFHYAPYNGKALIYAEDEENITLSGDGVIHGQGDAFYDRSEDAEKLWGRWWPILDRAARPGRMIFFALCRNVVVEGLSFVESPAWTFWMMGCERVRFHGVTIRTSDLAINTDGIDIDSCRDVVVSHCDITTGDDAIILRAIDRIFNPASPEPTRTGILNAPRPCEQVTVENCTLSSRCQAIRLSYIGDGEIRNATFRNLTISNSTRGIVCQIPVPKEIPKLRTDLPELPGPVVENIHFSNITVEADQPLWFSVSEGAKVRRVGSITFENITLRGCVPSVFKGQSTAPITNLSLCNITVAVAPQTPTKPSTSGAAPEPVALALQDVDAVSLRNIRFEGDTPERAPSHPLMATAGAARLTQENVVNATRFPLITTPA